MFEPIGQIRSPFPEKFGIPRQPGLIPAQRCTIELDAERVSPEALMGLGQCSHLWVVFHFHATQAANKSTVRPPRLGGNHRLGSLATRSPFRPNPIGLSAVELLGIDGLTLSIAGGDFLDKTPVLDIKPYVPYADALPHATCAWAEKAPARCAVNFGEAASETLDARADGAEIRNLIEQTLALDPRPAYRKAQNLEQKPDPKSYGTRILDVDVHWHVADGEVHVHAIEPS